MSKELTESEEINQLTEVFLGLPEHQQTLLRPQIIEAVSMRRMLVDLRKDIKKTGLTEVFTQGSVSYIRETPSVKLYNSIVKNYIQLMKQLMSKMPEGGVHAGDKLLEFIAKRSSRVETSAQDE